MDALRNVNKSFDILCEQSNLGTGLTRMREYFALTPATGLQGQTEVLRQYVILKARATANRRAEEEALRWSDDDIMRLVLSGTFPMP